MIITICFLSQAVIKVPELQPLLAAMRQALPFPFNSDLVGDPFERLVAISLSCRIRLLFQKIASPVSSA